MWNLILGDKPGGKCSRFLDDAKYGAFFRTLEQKFNIQYHVGIFDPVIVEGQKYDDAASQDLIWMCELFGSIWFLFWS